MATKYNYDDASVPLQDVSNETDLDSQTYVFTNEDDDNKQHTLESALELAGHGRYNYLLLFTCSLILDAVAMDCFGYAIVVTAASCDLNLDLTRHGILAACPFAGIIFAYPWGYFVDTQGRKRALLLSTSVSFVFAILSSFATHWIFMLVMKIIGTSFSIASFTITTTMLCECTTHKHRNQYLFIMNIFNVSEDFFAFTLAWFILPLKINITISWLGITYKSWRLFAVILAMPLGIGACLMTCLNESPKFLASRGDYSKALEVLKNIYERNGGTKGQYPVKHLVQSPSDLDKSTNNETFWSSLKRQTLPIFQLPLLWRTIQLFFLMSLCCLTNNAFVVWYPTIVDFFFKSFNEVNNSSQTFCQRLSIHGNKYRSIGADSYECDDELSLYTIYAGMIYGLFFGFSSLIIVKIASRPKLVIIIILFVSGISFLSVNVKEPIANLIFFTLLQTTSLGIGCILSYAVNLYSTVHRGQVSGLCMMVGRLSAFIGINVIGHIITEYCEITFYTWSILIFGSIIVCLFLPADKKTG